MPTQRRQSGGLEIAHVLFMDIVGFSLLPMDEQTGFIGELQDLLRGTHEFRRAESSGNLIRLPTGDGVVFVFFNDPVAPVQCAMQLSRALKNRPHIKLRMGVHSGPVYRVEDINANQSVSGGGVNIAQRVMDCGDAGHILLSSAAAELLRQVGAWPLQDLGEFEVKHGERVHLYNLYTGELGNPELPERLRRQMTTATLSAAEPEVRPLGVTTQVAILYKRNAQPDEEVLQFLETQLVGLGYRVFIDRHLSVGVEWAKEIERQVRTSDAVIPLISPAILHSEMLAYEIQIAHEAAQHQNGKPQILPVRVNYEGTLPEHLSAILDPLEYVLWESVTDNKRLIEELLHALRKPPAPSEKAPLLQAPSMLLNELEPIGGAVPLKSHFYVVRPTDHEFLSAIARGDSIVLVKGARQMGKTSLLARGLQQARAANAKVVLTDLQKFNAAHLQTVETFLVSLAESIADQLALEVSPDESWNPRRSPNLNFERYLRREVLDKSPTHIVWALDEVDRLFTCDFGSEVFGLFRSWHNERSLDPSGPWSRLTLAVAYATEAHLFIRDLNQSPFNVGTRLSLEDFTYEQVVGLNERYRSPLEGEAETARFFRLVGGHPYLVRRGLHEITTRGLSIASFEAQADREEGPFGDHLRRILVSIAQDDDLCDVMRGVLRGQPCPTPESFYRLRSAGVVSGHSPQVVRPRCQLYDSYLQRHLL